MGVRECAGWAVRMEGSVEVPSSSCDCLDRLRPLLCGYVFGREALLTQTQSDLFQFKGTTAEPQVQERAPPSSAATPRPSCGACRPGLCRACWTLTTSAPATSPRWLPWSTRSRESLHREAGCNHQVEVLIAFPLSATQLGGLGLSRLAGEVSAHLRWGRLMFLGDLFPIN